MSLIHCKSCRKEKLTEEFKVKIHVYKTCNICRLKAAEKRKNAKEIKKNRLLKKLQECNSIAKDRGGKCLYKVYVNGRTKMEWECEAGHTWKTTFYNIKSHRLWCPYCAGNVISTIEDCKLLAKKREGKCLSESYKNCNMKMEWECFEKHKWKATFNNIKSNKSWCPHCYGNVINTIEDCKLLAKKRGGKCLSESYKNSKTKLLWECKKGHQWPAIFNAVKSQSTWCPRCKSYKSEEACRKIFEELLEDKFPNTKPKFLEGLELDGYNEKLNIAFEYNGVQHYEHIPFFHGEDQERFEKQKARDRKKYRICMERKLKLIIIPYQYTYKDVKELETFIEYSIFGELRFID